MEWYLSQCSPFPAPNEIEEFIIEHDSRCHSHLASSYPSVLMPDSGDPSALYTPIHDIAITNFPSLYQWLQRIARIFKMGLSPWLVFLTADMMTDIFAKLLHATFFTKQFFVFFGHSIPFDLFFIFLHFTFSCSLRSDGGVLNNVHMVRT